MPDSGGPLILTLDVGTSSVRAMLWDRHGSWFRGLEVETEHQMTVTADGGVETDPRSLFRRTARCIDLLLEKAGRHAKSVAAVGISTFWHSLMGVDNLGAPLTPLYTWADTRSQGAADVLRARLDERAVHARTGCMVHASYLPAKLLWLSRADPERFERAERWMSFGEYLFLRLFKTPALSISMASGTGMFDQDACAWDAEVLAAIPLREARLSKLADADQPLIGLRDRWARRWPALSDVPWFPAWGDGACSNVGSNCSTDQRMALMVGTSGALRVLWKANGVPPPPGLWRYRLDREYILIGGALSNGGNLMRWLRATLSTTTDRELLRAVAKLPADGHGLTVLPFLAGERSPDYRADARGAFVGVSLSTTPQEIVRASMESTSYRFATLHRLLAPVAPRVDKIIVNGGAILNRPVWMQITSDVLGRSLTASAEREATSRGAALMALQSIGALTSIEDAPDHLGAEFNADSERHAIYLNAAKRHQRLYHRLLDEPLLGGPPPTAEALPAGVQTPS